MTKTDVNSLLQEHGDKALIYLDTISNEELERRIRAATANRHGEAAPEEQEQKPKEQEQKTECTEHLLRYGFYKPGNEHATREFAAAPAVAWGGVVTI